jgi:hypothetical protein
LLFIALYVVVLMTNIHSVEFVDQNGQSLVKKLEDQLLEGDNLMIILFSSKDDGLTRIGNVDIGSCKSEHVFLTCISQLMLEKYHVTTVWKSTDINSKNYLQANLEFDLNQSHSSLTSTSAALVLL